MTSVHSVTRPPVSERADDAGHPVVEAPAAAVAQRTPAHAAPRPLPSPQRLRREKLAVIALLAAMLAATLEILAMQRLDAAPATAT